jgi:DNA-directed RNA polymerase subunit alpha
MSYNEFTYPTKTEVITKKDNTAKIAVYPCYPGYGVTLGNVLRRVMLSSIAGGAVTSLKIEGVKHEFSAVDGVYENIIDIILNIKKLRFNISSDSPVELSLSVKGKKKITGADIKKNSEAELINKEQYICELTENKSEIDMTITVEKGIGFSPVERRETKKKVIGVIDIDTSFSPVKKVSFEVVNTRIGKRTDYEKLEIEIETDGSLTPLDAFKSASAELSRNFAIMSGIKPEVIAKEAIEIVEAKEASENQQMAEEKAKEDEQNITTLETVVKKEEEDFNTYSLTKIGLPAKIVKILEEADITTVEELIAHKKEELMKIEGVGESVIKEIKKNLGKYGIILSK